MRMGVLADRKTSDAFFSVIRRRIFSRLPPLIKCSPVMGCQWTDRMPRRSGAAQQVVDAGLGAGLGVNALDDDRTVQRVLAIGRGQVAADHHRTGRDAAITYLPA